MVWELVKLSDSRKGERWEIKFSYFIKHCEAVGAAKVGVYLQSAFDTGFLDKTEKEVADIIKATTEIANMINDGVGSSDAGRRIKDDVKKPRDYTIDEIIDGSKLEEVRFCFKDAYRNGGDYDAAASMRAEVIRSCKNLIYAMQSGKKKITFAEIFVALDSFADTISPEKEVNCSKT